MSMSGRAHTQTHKAPYVLDMASLRKVANTAERIEVLLGDQINIVLYGSPDFPHRFDAAFSKLLCLLVYSFTMFQVIQRRKDGKVNFDRTWKDYKEGFGKVTEDFWIGWALLL